MRNCLVLVRNRKYEDHYYQIKHIQISLGTTFELKHTIFLIKYAKRIFCHTNLLGLSKFFSYNENSLIKSKDLDVKKMEPILRYVTTSDEVTDRTVKMHFLDKRKF